METTLSSYQPAGGGTGSPGLWRHLPAEMPVLEPAFWENRHDLELHETAFVLARAFLGHQIPDEALAAMVRRAFPADALLFDLAPADLVLELFDGPTGTYCDFGARLAAELLGWRYRDSRGGFNVVAALPPAQAAAALSALTAQRCCGLFLQPGHFADDPGAAGEAPGQRWTLARCGEDFPGCERRVEALLGAGAEDAGDPARPLATIREDSFPWVLGLASALLHSCNQLPAGVEPAFVIPASCVALHAAAGLLERLGVPVRATVHTSTGDGGSGAGLPHQLTGGESAVAVRELKALYNYDCSPDGATAWGVAQIWRGRHPGTPTIAVMPFSPSACGEMPAAHRVNLDGDESVALRWFREWMAQSA